MTIMWTESHDKNLAEWLNMGMKTKWSLEGKCLMSANVRLLGLIVSSLNDTMQKEMHHANNFFRYIGFKGQKK